MRRFEPSISTECDGTLAQINMAFLPPEIELSSTVLVFAPVILRSFDSPGSLADISG